MVIFDQTFLKIVWTYEFYCHIHKYLECLTKVDFPWPCRLFSQSVQQLYIQSHTF